MPSLIQQLGNRLKQGVEAKAEVTAPTAPFAEYADRPVEFALEVLGVEYLTPEQCEIMNHLLVNSETNVQAAHGVGKTFLAGLLVLHQVFAIGGLAVSTAPTNRQVKELLWKEIRRVYDRNEKKLGGTRGTMFIKLTEDMQAYGFASYDYSSNTFQGIHSAKLLIIQDEANGISPEIDEGASSCLTGTGNRLLRIGNPTVAQTPFHKACKLQHIRLPVWSHPNVAWAYQADKEGVYRLKPEIAEAVLTGDRKEPVKEQKLWPPTFPRDRIPGAVSIAWIEKQRINQGEQSAYWTSRLNAYFPEDNAQSIIPRSLFMKGRWLYDNDPKAWDTVAERFAWKIGLDVGDGGDDHALARWRGPVLYFVQPQPTRGDWEDTGRAASWGLQTLRLYPGTIGVDRTGVGAGTLDSIIKGIREDRLPGCEAVGCVFGGASPKEKVQKPNADPERFYSNWKAYWYFQLRLGLERGNVAIAPLGDYEDLLADEFASIYYEQTPKGLTQIEDKAETIKRLGHSPNCADAVIMGYSDLQALKKVAQIQKTVQPNSAAAVRKLF
jgi:hypothetical protein